MAKAAIAEAGATSIRGDGSGDENPHAEITRPGNRRSGESGSAKAVTVKSASHKIYPACIFPGIDIPAFLWVYPAGFINPDPAGFI